MNYLCVVLVNFRGIQDWNSFMKSQTKRDDLYMGNHSQSKYVQTEDHTLRQEEFSTSVDEDCNSLRYISKRL